nr:AEC family transporter [uncultured Blautia sp.]
MSGLVVMKQMIIIFALIMAGFLLHKRRILSSAASKDMSALVLNLCSPALIVSSMFSDLTSISRKNVGLVALIGILCFAFLIILGYALTKILRVPVSRREAYILMTVFGNLGFIGLPVASAVLGPKSMVYVIVFNFLFNVVIFTFGIMLVKKGVEGVEQSWTDIFSPGFIACILAFIIYWFNIKIPADLQSLVNYCGNACTLLSLLVIGMSLVGMNLGSVFKNKRLLLFTAIRFIAVPIALALLLKPFLPDYIMRASIVLMMSLPVANMPMMMAEQYGKETTTISEGIILSTVLSAATISLVFLFV